MLWNIGKRNSKDLIKVSALFLSHTSVLQHFGIPLGIHFSERLTSLNVCEGSRLFHPLEWILEFVFSLTIKQERNTNSGMLKCSCRRKFEAYSLDGLMIYLPYYRKLIMHVDNAKKIYVTQN